MAGQSSGTSSFQDSEEEEEYGYGDAFILNPLVTSMTKVITKWKTMCTPTPNVIYGIHHPKKTDSQVKNQCEQIMITIGKLFYDKDKPNSFRAVGFMDATQKVFNIQPHFSSSRDVLEACRNSVPPTAGTSYAPVIEAAIEIVKNVEKKWQYFVLVIIANGQITRNPVVLDENLSPLEKETVESIERASSCGLMIIVVGVGDGPWEDMMKLISKIPIEFINFTNIMSKDASAPEKEAMFALAFLKGFESQFNAMKNIKDSTSQENVTPRPPSTRSTKECGICTANDKDITLFCGHGFCEPCMVKLVEKGPSAIPCPECRTHFTDVIIQYPRRSNPHPALLRRQWRPS